MTDAVPDGGDAPDRRGTGGLALAPTPAWPGLEADFESLGAGLEKSRPARVAIASYEFAGVVRNGGIGTACTSLARALVEDGHDVDIVFTGWADDPSVESFDRWRAHYERLGLRLDRIDPAASGSDAVLYNAVHSLALYRLLAERDRERPYDAIHFVESVGHGFYSLLAKHQGLAFQSATTVVGVHSPRRWLAEAHGVPFDHALDIGDEFLERRSIELADVVVSPSAHMLDWLERRGAVLPKRSYVQQYVTSFDSSAHAAGRDGDELVRELVFFGRLEPRKGLLAFCDALDLLADRPCAELRRVTFLGRGVPFGDVSCSDDYVRDRASDWPWDVEVVTDLDRDDALDYLRAPGRLAVMASTMDNSPNTVYEAIGLGIPFLASRGGGTAELVHPDDYEHVTYDPRDPEVEEVDPGDPASTRSRHTGRVLAARLEQALAAPPLRARFAVNPARNCQVHIAWHRALVSNGDRPPGTARTTDGAPRLPAPRTVGDLATADSVDELLLLVDPDVEPAADLASSLSAAAAACPEAGFLTSLGTFGVETPGGETVREYVPVGGSPAAGLVGNCFGAGVALARRDALERIGAWPGGLPADAGVAALLARAALAGERIDVVPEVLYRLAPGAAPGGLSSRAEAPQESLAAYHHALRDGVARDVVSVARRALAEAAALRPRAEAAERAAAEAHHAAAEAASALAEAERDAAEAERDAAEAHARLAIVTSSRSWRLTGVLRRLVATLRRTARRG